jgi:hypothetical protein
LVRSKLVLTGAKEGGKLQMWPKIFYIVVLNSRKKGKAEIP